MRPSIVPHKPPGTVHLHTTNRQPRPRLSSCIFPWLTRSATTCRSWIPNQQTAPSCNLIATSHDDSPAPHPILFPRNSSEFVSSPRLTMSYASPSHLRRYRRHGMGIRHNNANAFLSSLVHCIAALQAPSRGSGRPNAIRMNRRLPMSKRRQWLYSRLANQNKQDETALTRSRDPPSSAGWSCKTSDSRQGLFQRPHRRVSV